MVAEANKLLVRATKYKDEAEKENEKVSVKFNTEFDIVCNDVCR